MERRLALQRPEKRLHSNGGRLRLGEVRDRSPDVRGTRHRFNYNSGRVHNCLLTFFAWRLDKTLKSTAPNISSHHSALSNISGSARPPVSLIREGGLYLRTHDLARIAYLFLKNGVWEGKEIVTSDWVKESVAPAVAVSDDGVKYGLKWLAPSVTARTDPRMAWAGAGFGRPEADCPSGI